VEQNSSKTTLVPSFFKQPWDVVTMGRLAGAIVIVSALGLAIWDMALFQREELQYRIYAYWRTIIQIGAPGVIIILLAELVGRVTEYDEYKDEDGGEAGG
jgi:hypothetical protein